MSLESTARYLTRVLARPDLPPALPPGLTVTLRAEPCDDSLRPRLVLHLAHEDGRTATRSYHPRDREPLLYLSEAAGENGWPATSRFLPECIRVLSDEIEGLSAELGHP